MSDAIERLEAHVGGRVQGVGFRYFTTQQARRLGLDGWVRNEFDGNVRVVAEGPRTDLEQLVERLQDGPAGSRVEFVRPTWTTASGEFAGFTVRHT